MGRFGNFVVFQLTWFAAAIGAGRGQAWWGVAAVAMFAVMQLRGSATRGSDLRLVLAAAVAGFVLDSIFVATGLLSYAAPWPVATLAPAWIVSLWVALALTLNHSLRWVRATPWLAGLLGMCAAPLSYLGAARGWQAVEFATPIASTLGVVALCWGILVFALVRLARQMARSAAVLETQPAQVRPA